MAILVSEAVVDVPDPARLAADLAAHMIEHDVAIEDRDGRTVAKLGFGAATLSATARSLDVRLEAEDQGALEMLRSVIATHIVEFTPGQAPVIVWSGTPAGGGESFANFRELRVRSVADLTPRMRRLTFAGDRLDRFATDADIHVRLYFPPEGLAVPEWPRPGADGRTLWPPDDRRPTPRYYTLRHVRPEAGELDIDFVLHDDAGPGAAFAANARRGDICGMIGPLGRGAAKASFHVFLGDETALPAIARMAESLPADARGVACIEIHDARDQVAIAAPPGVDIGWLHRAEARHRHGRSALIDAVHALAFPEDHDVFVWAGCEITIARELRRHLRHDRGLDRSRHLVVGYWEAAGGT